MHVQQKLVLFSFVCYGTRRRSSCTKEYAMHIPVRAVIFDFDGTIIDSYLEGFRRVKEIALSHGVHFGADAQRRFLAHWGLPGTDLLRIGLGISEQRATTLYEAWEHYDQAIPIPLIKGAKDTFYWLQKHNIYSALLTSRNRIPTEPLLDRLDIVHEFTYASFNDDTPWSKPHKRVFESMLSVLKAKHGVTAEECLYVGDTASDMAAGINAEIETILVKTGPYHHQLNMFPRVPDTYY